MLEITYQKFIQNILDTRGRFACGDEYYERHHIVPKCMGGGDEKDNLIDLYAREHFVAHKLLAEENPDNRGLIYAWMMMAWIKTANQERYQVTPKEYEDAKIALAKINSERKGILAGENNPMYGVRRFGESNPNYGNHKLAGKNNPRARPIIQLTKDLKFVRRWDYISEAANFLEKGMENIVSCCKYNIPSAYGYIWVYEEEYLSGEYLNYVHIYKKY